MKARLVGVTLALALCSMSMVAWTPSAMADKDKTMSASEFRDVLKDLKCEFTEEKDGEDKTMFKITKPVPTTLLQYGGEGDVGSSIALSSTLELPYDIDDINAWNYGERFTKAYIDDDENVVFESDLDVSVAPNKAIVKKFIEQYIAGFKKFTLSEDKEDAKPER